jgi:hypothetical protein
MILRVLHNYCKQRTLLTLQNYPCTLDSFMSIRSYHSLQTGQNTISDQNHFPMTINKAQGQTLKCAGMYLPSLVFLIAAVCGVFPIPFIWQRRRRNYWRVPITYKKRQTGNMRYVVWRSALMFQTQNQFFFVNYFIVSTYKLILLVRLVRSNTCTLRALPPPCWPQIYTEIIF